MKAADLKNPGNDQAAQYLRQKTAVAISNAEQATNPGTALADFLSDAAQKTPGYTVPALPATQALVTNGATVVVKDADNSPTLVNAIVNIAASAVVDVTLSDPATGLAREAQTASVVSGAAAGNTSVPGTHVFRVAAGVVRVKLGTTVAPLSNGVKVPVGTITGSGTFFTPTIVDGVITGGVLSAS